MFQSKIALLHDAVNSGRLEELQSLLDEEPDKKKRLVLAKDEAGTGLLHKAVYYDLIDIAKWLIENFPQIVSTTDAVNTFFFCYLRTRTTANYSKLCLLLVITIQENLSRLRKKGVITTIFNDLFVILICSPILFPRIYRNIKKVIEKSAEFIQKATINENLKKCLTAT